MSVLRFLVMVFALVLVPAPPAPAVENESALTQRDWMMNLVDGLGWSFGLPDEPEDKDYLAILSGRRTFRIEAEDAKQPGDHVAVKAFKNFGVFSGSGWVSGVATPTTARLRFLLPLGGTYQVFAALRLPGHRITLAGREIESSGESMFTRVELGEWRLDAGMQELKIVLPPNGAIDYLELRAPDFAAIAPRGGWRPDEPLGWDDLAVTSVRLLGIEGLLPQASVDMRFEAENALQKGSATVAKTRYLGIPSGDRWVRAGTGAAEVAFSFTIGLPAVYRVTLAGTGTQPAPVRIDDAPPMTVTWPQFLDPAVAGTLFLDRGRHTLRVTLAPGAGLDFVHLKALRSGPGDYLRLAGLDSVGQVPVAGDIDRLLGLLAGIGAVR